MYLRWQSRKRNRPDIGHYGDVIRDAEGYAALRDRRGGVLRTCRDTGTQDVRWAAIIVESVRIDGKPRQRHVAYLASTTESRIAVVHQRRYFWDEVLDGLDRLMNRMSIEDRTRVEAAIALKVPRLTREEHEASVKECTETFPDTGQHKPYRRPLEPQ
jgi:hypothetical protein